MVNNDVVVFEKLSKCRAEHFPLTEMKLKFTKIYKNMFDFYLQEFRFYQHLCNLSWVLTQFEFFSGIIREFSSQRSLLFFFSWEKIINFFNILFRAYEANCWILKFTSLAQRSSANIGVRECLHVQHNFIFYVIKIHFLNSKFCYSNQTRFANWFLPPFARTESDFHVRKKRFKFRYSPTVLLWL